MKKISNIIILAGGESSRFWPLKNKILTPFFGKPYILHFIDTLLTISENILVVCSETNQKLFESQIGDKAQLIVQDKTKGGMAGALLSCKGIVHGDVLIIGNDLFDFSILSDMVNAINKDGVDLIFLAKKMNTYFPGGYVQFKDGKVTGIIEKPEPDKIPSNFVKIVVDYFKDIDKFILKLENIVAPVDGHYEQGISILMDAGKVSFLPYEGHWLTLKYPWHVLLMMKHFLDGIKVNKLADSKDLTITETAIIQGPVIMEKGVKVGHFAKITGPCYIGENTIISDYALVRESHIGKNCLIGSSCEVARSYLGDKVSLHRNYVGDSVLADGVLFGSGAVTANFRFDENEVQSVVKEKKVNTNMKKLGVVVGKNTKVGINTTLYPGVKIGSNCLIFPGEVVRKDVPDKI
ncbi:NTP transferase domain-containing protein [Candidatus Roizmanbacteria bacterium]|nr:NTP transferase domain-containing protein [Candidatus Roizmanbacteria bacterium]